MPVSGFGSGWAFAKETVYGTPVATTKALPFLSESLTLQKNWVTSNTLKGGNYLPTTSSSRQGSRVGGGDVQLLMYTHGTAALTEAMLGQIATTGAGPYVHTATTAATLPSYSMQVTYGATTSTMKKAVEGAKCDSWEIAVAVGENVTLGTSWIYEDEIMSTAGSLAGTYPASTSVYNANDFGTLTVNGVAYCVTNLTVSGNNNLKGDSFCIGQTTIANPTAQRREITGTVTIKLDQTNLALYNAWIAGTNMPIVATATQGASVFTINAPGAYLLGGTPVVSGEDELTVDLPYEIRASGVDSAAFSLVTTNSDSAP